MRRLPVLGLIGIGLVTVFAVGLFLVANQHPQRKGPASVAANHPPPRPDGAEPRPSEPAPSELPKPVPTDPARAAATSSAVNSTASARLASISISRIGVQEAPVFSGGVDAKGTMLIAPGYSVTHYVGSAGFGFGNSVLYGHDDIEGGVFRRLHDLKAGDEVQLKYAWGGQRTFRVAESRLVDPSAVEVLKPTGDVRLTIISCWPINVDNQRVIVTAFPV